MSDPVLSASSKKFLTALIAATSKTSVSLQLSEFYDLENDLRCKFAAKEPVPDSYANLVPIFHPKITSMGAHQTKARIVDENSLDEKYICALNEEKRRKDGEDSFVQNGFAGFKRNWDVFTEGALETVNWYSPKIGRNSFVGTMCSLLGELCWHVFNPSQKMS